MANNRPRKSKANFSINPPMTWDDQPLLPIHIDAIIDDLKTWPEQNPEAFYIEEFQHKHKIEPQTWFQMISTYPKLERIHRVTMQKLGMRLHRGAMVKGLDWKPVHFGLHSYSPSFKAWYTYHHDLEKEVASTAATPTIIEMPVYRTEKLDKFEIEKKEQQERKKLEALERKNDV